MDEVLALRWPGILDELVFAANPALAAIAAQLGHGPFHRLGRAPVQFLLPHPVRCRSVHFGNGGG